jgi:hypothetical protein
VSYNDGKTVFDLFKFNVKPEKQLKENSLLISETIKKQEELFYEFQ